MTSFFKKERAKQKRREGLNSQHCQLRSQRKGALSTGRLGRLGGGSLLESPEGGHPRTSNPESSKTVTLLL